MHAPLRFPEAPFWIDDDPARALAGRGVRGYATGAGVRDAALGRSPFAPRVVEILASGDAADLSDAIADLAPGPGGGSTRFVLRRLGDGPLDELADADARTRDFTANAVMCGLDGRVRDPLGGLADIAERRVRLAHPAALRDDPVRVIRLARMRILLGEETPDPEAVSEAAFYGPDVAGCPGPRVLEETLRLLRCGPAGAVAGALRRLDGVGALDGLALVPAIDRLARFHAACERAALPVDPILSLGLLCAVRVGRAGWIDGLRPRFGDSRDALAGRAAELLNRAPVPGEDPASSLARAAAAAG